MQDWDELKAHGDFYKLLGMPRTYPMMQYTGLKDKNGVKVFEGDILECEAKALHQVIFESYFACFNTMHIESGEVSDITKDTMIECFEVIGNIYESPELLK